MHADDSQELGRIIAGRKTGDEEFTDDGVPIGPRLADFWAWSMSDLMSNATRGILAEFIVAAALQANTNGVRGEWDAWDLTTPEGILVEVKSAAFLQSWAQTRLSSIVFSTRLTRAWDPETNRQATLSRRHAHVYVLALLHHLDQATVDPMCLNQWAFYVVPTTALDSRTRSQHSITLATLRREFAAPVLYRQLRASVLQAAGSNSSSVPGRPNR